MKLEEKKLRIEGLQCADCAARIESGIASLPEISSCEVSVILSSIKINVDADASDEETLRKIQHIADTVEPGTKVSREAEVRPTGEPLTGELIEEGNKELTQLRKRIFIGGILFILALLTHRIAVLPDIASWALYFSAYIVLGLSVVFQAVKNLFRGKVFDENFLMSVATIGAFFINSPEEAVAVMLFYQVGEAFQISALYRSKKSVRELLALRPDSANLKTADGIVKVSPDRVNVGDVIVIKPGEKVPLDASVLTGEAMLDTSAITGESNPREVNAGDSIMSGSVNLDGVLEAEVKAVFAESTASKMIALVTDAAARKSKSETVISKFARIYTPVVVISALLLAVIPIVFFSGEVSDWVYRALAFLVISCPCALVLSVPLGYFAGIGAAGRKGIFVKGGGVLDTLAATQTVVFDKTGTLTKGNFSVTRILPYEGISEEKLLLTAITAETFSDHPIAISVLDEGRQRGLEAYPYEPSSYREIAGRGVQVTTPDGSILLGNRHFMRENQIDSLPEEDVPGTVLYAAENGKFIGRIVLTDKPKKDAAEAVKSLLGLGIKRIVMLTGDHEAPAKETAGMLGIKEVFSELLPQQKLEKLELLLAEQGIGSKGKLVFVGDGINDAPVLARADAGAAIGQKASAAAIEASDLVIMTDDVQALPTAIELARKTKRIVTQSIVISLVVKGVILLTAAFGYTNLWLAVFADVGVTLIAVLNSLRAGRTKKTSIPGVSSND